MRFVQSAVLLGCLAFLLATCGGGGIYEEGCMSDLECKHGRICVDGKCQDQSQVCFGDGDCGPCSDGTSCMDGRCVTGCVNECETGESRCMDAYSFSECGDWDDDRSGTYYVMVKEFSGSRHIEAYGIRLDM